MYQIPLTDMVSFCETVFQQAQFTPLILDETSRADTFYHYSEKSTLVDLRAIIAKVEIQKSVTIDEVKDQLRQRLVAALKYGYTVVFSMVDSAFLFSKFTDPNFFPACLLQQGGRLMHQESIFKPLLRDQGRPDFVVHPEFRVMVTSQFPVDEFEDYLRESLDLAQFVPIAILPQ